ncbi:MAG: sugar transferase [Proteobacteria bacterium]|nr:sugar transferase [Pseudomonadota bacterium]
MDIVLSLAVLPVVVPVLAVAALWIKLDSPGPVLYRQERVGRHGRLFRIHKLRTMRVHDDRGSQLTQAGDARITRAGRWLRRRRVDELPQLWDVLKGDMSLVGPRPEVPRYMACYPEEARRRILSVRPGITERAALELRDEDRLLASAADPERVYIEQILPLKQRYALDYVAHHSLWSDLRILWATLGVLWHG